MAKFDDWDKKSTEDPSECKSEPERISARNLSKHQLEFLLSRNFSGTLLDESFEIIPLPKEDLQYVGDASKIMDGSNPLVLDISLFCSQFRIAYKAKKFRVHWMDIVADKVGGNIERLHGNFDSENKNIYSTTGQQAGSFFWRIDYQGLTIGGGERGLIRKKTVPAVCGRSTTLSGLKGTVVRNFEIISNTKKTDGSVSAPKHGYEVQVPRKIADSMHTQLRTAMDRASPVSLDMLLNHYTRNNKFNAVLEDRGREDFVPGKEAVFLQYIYGKF